MKNILALFLLSTLMAFPAYAEEAAAVPAPVPAASEPAPASGLPIPRFVSLRSDKVFVRTGPALRYPIKWVYNKADLPIEIVQEFDTWRKIRDKDGEEGWVHQSLLSARRSALVTAAEPVNLNKGPDLTTLVMAKLEPGVLAAVKSCDGTWCEVEAEGYDGFTSQKSLWGVYAGERFN